jgi:hypothetical protein
MLMRRFLKGLLIFVLGGLLGTGFGFAMGIFWFPFLFPPPPANEVMAPAEKAAPVVATGDFIHADPSDRIHWGRGKLTVYQNTVFLEPDFEVGPGPDYRVYLVPKSNIRKNADMRGVKFVDLGGLRAFKGSQRYEIPANINLADYQSVVIWCRAFGQLISPADFKKK